MTLLQVIAAGAAFGVASQLAMYAVGFLNGFINGVVAAIVNRRAMALRLHTRHCATCVEPMGYYCWKCGAHDPAPNGPMAGPVDSGGA